jgi:Domain of unknown function (DUF4386)
MTLRTNARIAGFTFLLYIAVGVTQMVLGGETAAGGIAATLAAISQHAAQVRVNIVLTLLICVTAMVLAVALYGLTRDVDRDVAVLALSFRLGEGLLAAIAPMTTLGLLWLATAGTGADPPDTAAANALGAYLLKVRSWNVTITATLFAVGSTLFSWLLLRGRLIPVPLAWLGVVASVLLVLGLPLGLVGFVPSSYVQILWLPMAAFEIPLALWLLIKGVAVPARSPAT